MPKQARLTREQASRIDRARLAMQLHKLPHELDAAPLADIADVLVVMKMDRKIAQMKKKV